MPNLLHIAGDPLRPRNIERVRKELEQTAVAVSVMGTSHQRLKQLASLAEPIAETLVGARPEVRKARSHLRRSMHNVRTSPIDARHAAGKIRNLAAAVEDVAKLVGSGLGDVDTEPTLAGIDAVNVWGFTETELRPTERVLRKAVDAMKKVGLTVPGIELSGDGPRFATYLSDRDAIDINPDHALTGSALNVIIGALADRVWILEFRTADYETWGHSMDAFVEAFVSTVRGSKLDSELAARLQTTVGKLAAKWPEVAA
jgi:hypothetical protein